MYAHSVHLQGTGTGDRFEVESASIKLKTAPVSPHLQAGSASMCGPKIASTDSKVTALL